MTDKCQHGYDRTSSYCPHCDNRSRVLPLEQTLARTIAELSKVKAQRDRLVVLVDRASEAIGRFTGDEGSTDKDFDLQDDLCHTLASLKDKP